MTLEVKPSVVFNTHYRLEKVQCYANGSFSLNVKRLADGKKELLLFDGNGHLSLAPQKAKLGVILYNSSFILFGKDAKNNFKNNQVVYKGIIPMGEVYNSRGEVIASGFENFKIFSNGWYMLEYREHKELYSADSRLQAKDFVDCEVLENGYYALRTDSKLYKNGCYEVYTLGAKKIATIKDVHQFMSSNLALQKTDTEGVYTLINFKGEEIVTKVIGYQKFLNQKFSLTFKNGSSAMYDDKGNRLSTFTGPNAKFLPDNTFIIYRQKMVDTRYRSNGLMIKREIFRCEEMSNYFLLTTEFKTELYNDKGEVIDENILIASLLDNFVLLQKEDKYHLYNQFGKVLEFDVI